MKFLKDQKKKIKVLPFNRDLSSFYPKCNLNKACIPSKRRKENKGKTLVDGPKKKETEANSYDSFRICVFHGATPFISLKSKAQNLATYFRACISDYLQCEKCYTSLERFLAVAPKHQCIIQSIDYPAKTEGFNKALPYAKESSHTEESFSGSSYCNLRSFDEFRVQAICNSSHKFLLTEDHLHMKTWCPICPVRNQLFNSSQEVAELKGVTQASKTQDLQRKLLDEAHRAFLNVFGSYKLVTSFTAQRLPPCFTATTPKNMVMKSECCTAMKLDRHRMSRDDSSFKETIIQSLARRDACRYKSVTYSQALAIIRILRSYPDPISILQIRKPCTLKDAQVAYRSLARQVHPDKNPHPDAKLVFHLLLSAWQSLIDSSRLKNTTVI